MQPPGTAIASAMRHIRDIYHRRKKMARYYGNFLTERRIGTGKASFDGSRRGDADEVESGARGPIRD